MEIKSVNGGVGTTKKWGSKHCLAYRGGSWLFFPLLVRTVRSSTFLLAKSELTAASAHVAPSRTHDSPHYWPQSFWASS